MRCSRPSTWLRGMRQASRQRGMSRSQRCLGRRAPRAAARQLRAPRAAAGQLTRLRRQQLPCERVSALVMSERACLEAY